MIQRPRIGEFDKGRAWIFLYLAVQISQPAPPTPTCRRKLIRSEKFSPEAVGLSGLTDGVLRPPNPDHPRFRTAGEVLDEIVRIDADVKSGRYDNGQIPRRDADASKPRVWIYGSVQIRQAGSSSASSPPARRARRPVWMDGSPATAGMRITSPALAGTGEMLLDCVDGCTLRLQ